MSKIQKALDKLKLSERSKNNSKQELEGADSSLNDDSVEFKKLNTKISDMFEPDMLTTKEKSDLKIIDAAMTDRLIFNAFRDLRTSVFQKTNKPNPIIMVTSCNYRGGSTFVSLNLAAAIANDETKTSLLIDCNLQNPGLSNLPVTKEEKIGMRDYLMNSAHSIKRIIYPTGIPRLRVIPVGIANQPMAEYFTNNRLKSLFSEIKTRYDQRFIIVDAPPIYENADARILADVCDYVVLTVPYGKVDEEKVLNAARTIGKEKLLGCVFNNQPRPPRLTWK